MIAVFFLLPVRAARGGLGADAEVLAEAVHVGAVREAGEALRAAGHLRVACQHPGRDRRGCDGLTAAAALVTLQHGEFRAGDGAVGAPARRVPGW